MNPHPNITMPINYPHLSQQLKTIYIILTSKTIDYLNNSCRIFSYDKY